MTQTYAQRRRAQYAPERAGTRAAGPSVSELAAGAAPTQEQMGSRVDLPGEIREKMETSFGADFSNVKLYESDTVAKAGAEAVTQGNSIAFAPGKLDLASTAGQALLGHELSHVVSQSRGESAGQGFLNDSRLEAQADTQGMLAARGESVYQGPVSPVGASSAMGASGPMQAKKKDKKAEPEPVVSEDGELLPSPLAKEAEANNISEPQMDWGADGWWNDLRYKSPSDSDEGCKAFSYSATDEAPSEELMRELWRNEYIGYLQQDRDRLDNGLTFENFKKGIGNLRKRWGHAN